MKTTAITVTALLASAAFAQPYHGRHVHKKDIHKREYVTTWVTQTETATLIIDQYGTSLVEPSPGQFYTSTSEGTTSTTSTSSTSTSTSSTSTSTPTTSSTSTTPTSTYVQPQPTTTSQAQETTPTTTTEAPVYTQTTSEAAAPTSTSSSSGGSGGGSGDITYYDLGLGACGIQLGGMTPTGATSSDPAVVAVAYDRFTAANPNNDPLCGKLIKITAGGKTGYGMIRDRCQACAWDDLDLNIEAFSHFYDPSAGRMPATWEFV